MGRKFLSQQRKLNIEMRISMFPSKFSKNGKEYVPTNMPNSIGGIKKFLLENPNEVYAIADEKLEEIDESMITEFLIVYIEDFNDEVTLYDLSRDRHSVLTINMEFLLKGYIEHIEVGKVDRLPLVLYSLNEKTV